MDAVNVRVKQKRKKKKRQKGKARKLMERHSNKVNERVKSVRDATADGIYVKYIYGNCNFAFSLY